MRPIKLELAGFTCFKAPQSIIFESLELFAIQGQTGAGKSSILDAITYALYGQTPRLGSRGLEALVSQGAAGMYVTLEFESGFERYRVSRIWSIKASERQIRFERVISESGTWVTAVEGIKVKDLNHAIALAVGLDFEAFTRAILLPQGEFDRFLRGDASERRELLKGLLNLQQFESMREIASNLARDLKSQIDQKNFLLTGEYAQANPEILERMRNQYEEILISMTNLSFTLERTRSELEDARELSKLSQQLLKVRQNLLSLEQAVPDVATARTRAALARRVASVLPRLEASERAAQVLNVAQIDFNKHQHILQTAHEQKTITQQRLDAVLNDVKMLPALELELTAARAIEPKMQRLKALGGSAALKDPLALLWSEESATKLEQIAAQIKSYQRTNTNVKELEQSVLNGQKRILELSNTLEKSKHARDECMESVQELKQASQTLESNLELATRQNVLTEITQGLNIGDDCPVCGQSLTRVPVFGISEVPELQTQLKLNQHDLEVKRSDFASFKERARLLEDQLSQIKEDQTRLETTLETQKLELTEWRVLFQMTLGAFDDPSVVLEQQRKRLLAGLALEIRTVVGERDPNTVIKLIVARCQEIQSAHQAVKDLNDRAHISLLEAKSAFQAAMSLCEMRRTEADDRMQELQIALSETGLTDVLELKAATLSEMKIIQLEQMERDHREKLSAYQSEQSKVLESLAGRNHDTNKLTELKNQLKTLELEQQTANQTLGKLKADMGETERRIELAKTLRRELATIAKQYDIYAQLALDLKGNEFQEFMLTQVQSELLARASTIMNEVTRERYQLTLQDGEYHVLDHWNGMEARSVKTLSGGESFIASLSLALALSDDLAGHKSLGALFLDEGFGTLDAEALDAVTGVLETIQTQGRMVGVITHVTSLAERLPNRLIVEKHIGSSHARWDTQE